MGLKDIGNTAQKTVFAFVMLHVRSATHLRKGPFVIYCPQPSADGFVDMLHGKHIYTAFWPLDGVKELMKYIFLQHFGH